MEDKPGLDSLIRHVRDYAEERIKLITLNIHDKVSRSLSDMASAMVIVLLIIFTLLFLSLALSWWLGSQLNDPFLGFLIVGGFYLVIAIVIYINRKKWIHLPVTNTFLKNMTDEEN